MLNLSDQTNWRLLQRKIRTPGTIEDGAEKISQKINRGTGLNRQRESPPRADA
jgi:hypothetical protein